MKFDKETFSRHRFWYALGAFLLVWFIGWMTVRVSGSSQNKTVKDKFDTANKNITSAISGDPKTAAFWDPWLKSAQSYHDHIQVVHKAAWELQQNNIVWPESSRGLQDKWATADTWSEWLKKFTEDPRWTTAALDDYRRRLYRLQFDQLYRRIGGPDEKEPKLEKMLAPVEFKGGEIGFKTMMMPTVGTGGGGIGAGPGPARGDRGPMPMAPGAPNAAGGRTIDDFFEKQPTAEECWYAQEDFWVKSEVLWAVKRTLDAVGKFSREEHGFWANVGHLAEHPDRPFGPYAPIKGEPGAGRAYVPQAECRYRNSSWELHLAFEKEGEKKYFVSANSSLKNVHPSKRVQAGSRPASKGEKTRQALQFRLKQKIEGIRAPVVFTLDVKTEDLAWNGEAQFKEAKEILSDDFDPLKPFEVEQVFDWYTSPIRRIDEIKTCYHSHRDANVQLKIHPGFAPKDDPANPMGGQPSPAPAPAPMPAGPAPMPGGPMGMPTGPALPQPTEYNSLERNRYLNATDTCRDLPFAVVLVVEQPHMHDFLVQLANSQLRVQITQVHFNRVRNIAPNPVEQSTDPARPGGPREEIRGRPDTGRPDPGRTGTTVGAERTDPNLVELTVYGIAAMYEKFNQKADAPKADGTKPDGTKPQPPKAEGGK
jgi:hypothetical protein